MEKLYISVHVAFFLKPKIQNDVVSSLSLNPYLIRVSTLSLSKNLGFKTMPLLHLSLSIVLSSHILESKRGRIVIERSHSLCITEMAIQRGALQSGAGLSRSSFKAFALAIAVTIVFFFSLSFFFTSTTHTSFDLNNHFVSIPSFLFHHFQLWILNLWR